MTTDVRDVIVLLRARRVPGKWSDTVTRDPLLQDAADLLEAAESRATAAEGRVALLEEALEPFASFGANVDENGWTSGIHREGISNWFGPSDFRRARLAQGGQ